MLWVMKIGFIGLGHMGSGMARNLLRAGHEVVVFNRSREKAEVLVADGARVADTPAGACSGSEAIMTMLADDHAVEQVVFGENGIASALPVGAIHISCSTIGIALAKRLAAEHRRRGQRYLSVPVFGRPKPPKARIYSWLPQVRRRSSSSAGPCSTPSDARRLSSDPILRRPMPSSSVEIS